MRIIEVLINQICKNELNLKSRFQKNRKAQPRMFSIDLGNFVEKEVHLGLCQTSMTGIFEGSFSGEYQYLAALRALYYVKGG